VQLSKRQELAVLVTVPLLVLFFWRSAIEVKVALLAVPLAYVVIRWRKLRWVNWTLIALVTLAIGGLAFLGHNYNYQKGGTLFTALCVDTLWFAVWLLALGMLRSETTDRLESPRANPSPSNHPQRW
jgi:hypothetical protein